MNEFEEYIKARYPVDYESLKEEYPNAPVCEFYGDEQYLWDLKQAKIDLIEKELTETQAFLNKQNHIKQVKINELQARINVYELHINTLKNIHECDFNEQSESSYILGNLDGFFECIDSDLKVVRDD